MNSQSVKLITVKLGLVERLEQWKVEKVRLAHIAKGLIVL